MSRLGVNSLVGEVSWLEEGMAHSVDLNTIRWNETIYPAVDSKSGNN